MQRYKITFRFEGHEQAEFVVGANRAKALKAFSKKQPDVQEQDIISISPATADDPRPSKIDPATRSSQPSTVGDATGYSSDYAAARGLSTFISGLGWLVVAGGLVAALAGTGKGSMLTILPGLGLAVSGIIIVAAGQVTRATVDNADHTREILALLHSHKSSTE